MKFCLTALLIVLFALISDSRIYAQPAYSMEAEQRFRSALETFEAGRYASAFLEFQTVYLEQPQHLKTTTAYLMAAKSLYRLGDYNRVIPLLSEFMDLFPTSGYHQEASRIIAASRLGMQRRLVDENAFQLGIALPLKESRVTTPLVRGILLSVEAYNRVSDSKVRVIFRDTGTSPEGAATATSSLADQGVTAIIGPLFSEQVKAAALVTERHDIALIAPLATDAGITAGHNYVFQVNATAEERGRAIARASIDYLSLTKIGIITESRSAQSQEVAKGFIEELYLRGFSPLFTFEVESSIDWSRLPILIDQDTLASTEAVLFSIDYHNENQAARHVQDGINSIGQAGLQPYILGPYSFKSLNLVRLQTQITAYFVDPYYDNDRRVQSHRFIESFKQSNNGSHPDQFAHIGYDMMEMLLGSIEKGGVLVDQILYAPLYDGVMLRIHFGGHHRNSGMYFFEHTPIGPQLIR